MVSIILMGSIWMTLYALSHKFCATILTIKNKFKSIWLSYLIISLSTNLLAVLMLFKIDNSFIDIFATILLVAIILINLICTILKYKLEKGTLTLLACLSIMFFLIIGIVYLFSANIIDGLGLVIPSTMLLNVDFSKLDSKDPSKFKRS